MLHNVVVSTIYVVVNCSYASLGLEALFSKNQQKGITFSFVKDVNDIPPQREKLFILFVVDLNTLQSVTNLRHTLTFIKSYRGKKKIGAVVSRCNIHVTSAISLWLGMRCVFFYA